MFGAADFSQDEASKAEQVVKQLGDVVAGGNLMAFNMISALSSDSSDMLEAIEKEFRTAQRRVKSNLDLLPNELVDHGAPQRGRGRAGAGRGQDRRLQDPPEGARRRRLRPDHSRRNPQAQCRPRDQRAAAGRRRAHRNRRLDLAGAPGDFAGDHRHAGARRRDPDRIGAVRLALCRPQHPAADRQPAALDAAAVQRRSRERNLSLQPARRNRGDGRIRCRCSAKA